MSKKAGILLSSNGDLMIENGHLAIGNTLYQNQYIILKAQKGELKELPLWGVGIEDMTNDNDIPGWKKLVREELARDGMVVSHLEIKDSELILKANYK